MLIYLLLLLLPAQAATLEVCTEGCPWSTIQEAVDAAEDGDTITVAAGVYTGSADIEKSVDLVGEGSTVTLLQGPWTLVSIHGGVSVSVSGFTLGVAEHGRGLDIRDAEAQLDDLVVSDVATAAEAAGLYAEGATVVLTDCSFEGITASRGRGGAVALHGSSLEANRARFTSCEAQYGGAIYAEDSSVVLTEVEASDCIASLAGSVAAYVETEVAHVGVDVHDNGERGEWVAAIWSEGGTFSDIDGVYSRNEGIDGGLFIKSPATLEGTSFTENNASGSVLQLHGWSARLSGLVLSDNTGGGGIDAGFLDELIVEECSFSDDTEQLQVTDTAVLSVTDSRFERAQQPIYYDAGSREGARVELRRNHIARSTWSSTRLTGYGSLLVQDNLWCANTTRALNVSPAPGAVTTISNNRFVGNEALEWSGLFLTPRGSIHIAHNDFIGNTGQENGSALTLSPPDELDELVVTNNLIAHQRGVPAVFATTTVAEAQLDYNLYWDNEAGDLSSTLEHGEHDVLADPELGWEPGASCEELFLPACPGPTVDAGHPDGLDPDGSRADIGAYGGPNAPAQLFDDADGDGWRLGCDCDDQDASSHPEADDLPGDGIDQDCDGQDAQPEDTDPADTGDEEPRCGCATGSRGWSWGLVLGPLVFVTRRRE